MKRTSCRLNAVWDSTPEQLAQLVLSNANLRHKEKLTRFTGLSTTSMLYSPRVSAT